LTVFLASVTIKTYIEYRKRKERETVCGVYRKLPVDARQQQSILVPLWSGG